MSILRRLRWEFAGEANIILIGHYAFSTITPDTWLALATTSNGLSRTVDCNLTPFPSRATNIEISITDAAIIFWYRPLLLLWSSSAWGNSSPLLQWRHHRVSGVLFWLRSSGDPGSLILWHEALWRWSRAGCWIISGVSVVSPPPMPRASFPLRGILIGDHFNVFIWRPMLQIKILSRLRGELYTPGNDCNIQMLRSLRRVGGESMSSGCQRVCAPCLLRVSAPVSRHVTVLLPDNNNPLITTK